MKALTVCQPYAQLIARGEKLVENRTWPTNYRGPLLIHAGKSRSWLDPVDEMEFSVAGDPLVFGALICVANLVDVLDVERIRRGDFDSHYPWIKSHEHTEGPWCWVLSPVRRLAAPISWRGAQGLWSIDENALPAPLPLIKEIPST